MTCTICGSARVVRLPEPNAFQSLISDGSICSSPLRKQSCCDCGVASHEVPLSQSQVRAFYAENYDLGKTSSSADFQRAKAYGTLIENLAPDSARRVLEVGCGGGLVLERLSARNPAGTFIGLEAASALARPSISRNLTIQNCYLEDFVDDAGGFDFIYAINVFEHALDPLAFLAKARSLVREDGRIALVFPSSIPNLELLFIDHIHTFTPGAAGVLAGKCGLRVCEAGDVDGLNGDFQYIVLQVGNASEGVDAARGGFSQLAASRVTYLEQWKKLDAVIQNRALNRELDAFGAGEAAALLRVYAPVSWTHVARLLVDEPQAARRLGKQVVVFNPDEKLPGALLLATHPRSQPNIAQRFAGFGLSPIAWNDVITR